MGVYIRAGACTSELARSEAFASQLAIKQCSIILEKCHDQSQSSQIQDNPFEREETQEDRFIVPRFHLLGVETVGWFAFAFGTASTSHTAAENQFYYAAIELARY